MISAKIIADSKNQFGDRITSFELVMPRIILAEFNTHRMFSRNSASSRAIKFEKMLDMVKENPFIPYKWMKEHKGMQGYEYFTEEEVYKFGLKEMFLDARDYAIEKAERLNRAGLTKQIVNRLLEPFMWHKVILTSTEFENFFALRYNEAAEIHIQELARLMLFAYNASTPKELKDGEWHIPYGDDIDMLKLHCTCNWESEEEKQSLMVAIATSRCAGVSYTVIGEDGEVENYEKLIKRHDNLSKSGHWSPFEHCAKAMDNHQYHNIYVKSDSCTGEDGESPVPNFKYGFCGNFKGFIQYRKMFENENKTDSRVIKK